jgi:hypothetical protein
MRWCAYAIVSELGEHIAADTDSARGNLEAPPAQCAAARMSCASWP